MTKHLRPLVSVKKNSLFRNLFVFLKARYNFEAHIVLVHFQKSYGHFGINTFTLNQSYQLR